MRLPKIRLRGDGLIQKERRLLVSTYTFLESAVAKEMQTGWLYHDDWTTTPTKRLCKYQHELPHYLAEVSILILLSSWILISSSCFSLMLVDPKKSSVLQPSLGG